VALRLLETATSFFSALMVFFLPLMTRARHEGQARDAYVRATVLGAQILLPGLVFIIGIWGDRISAGLFGAQYSLPAKVFIALSIGLGRGRWPAGPNGFALMAGRRHGRLSGHRSRSRGPQPGAEPGSGADAGRHGRGDGLSTASFIALNLA